MSASQRLETAVRARFVGEPVPTDHIQHDALWRLLASGKATVEDQQYAAGWIAKLTLPPTEAEVEAVGKTIWGLNWSRDPWQVETAERALIGARAVRKEELKP